MATGEAAAMTEEEDTERPGGGEEAGAEDEDIRGLGGSQGAASIGEEGGEDTVNMEEDN